jgi:hypothetical protein
MQEPKQPPRRVDVERVKERVEATTEQEWRANVEMDRLNYESQLNAFVAGYKEGRCYLCGNDFKTISRERPCSHWILRRGKFKKNDFLLLFERFGYTQLAALARWAANQEQMFGNINDLDEGRDPRKVFEFTVRWKNIEWTFDCSENDYAGHGGAHSDFPHWHFQMRIDGRPFIDFGDFHIPLLEGDLFRLDLMRQAPGHVDLTFGDAGRGMQFASEIDPDQIIAESTVVEEGAPATYRMQTFIMGGENGMDGEALRSIVEESMRTGETMASLARKRMGADHSVNTVIFPADTVPEVAKRTPRKRR